LAKVCYYCKGDRILRNGNYCHVCGGTGKHPDWEDKDCGWCTRSFEYCLKWPDEPDYCPLCQETQYKQCPNCGGRIHYKIFWNNIPEYCKCRGFRSKYCANARCRKEFFYHCEQERVSDYCKDCRQWQYKQCPNGDGTIRYKIYWENIPDYCKECNQWQEEPCPYCNRGTIQYKIWWNNPPTMCKDCDANKDQIALGLRSVGEEVRFRSMDRLPNIGMISRLLATGSPIQTPEDCGCIGATAYREFNKQLRREVIHVAVYADSRRTKKQGVYEEHFSYYLEPDTGAYIEGSLHGTTSIGPDPVTDKRTYRLGLESIEEPVEDDEPKRKKKWWLW